MSNTNPTVGPRVWGTAAAAADDFTPAGLRENTGKPPLNPKAETPES